MQTTRRQFIHSGVGCAVSLGLSPLLAQAAAEPKKLPIGLQLYAVRGEFTRDVPRTLRTIGQIGYKGVEFWGYGGTETVFQQYSATDLKKLLDENHLKCCGIHLELKALAGDNLKRTVDNNRVLGNTYLNVAAAKDMMVSEQKIAQLAATLNEAAAKVRPEKMVVGYHAHPFDFVKVQGRFAWDLLFSRAIPQVNMQMDIGNCLAGDGDPIAMLKKFPGRTRTIHIKEHQDKTFASGYYKEVFGLCEGTSATEWYIVEMGGTQGDGFEIPREALSKLRDAGKC